MSYTLVVNNKEYSLPEDYTVEQWVTLSRSSHNPTFMIAVGMGMPIDEAELLPEDTKILALSLINAILKPSWKSITHSIAGGSLIDLDDMTMGQFIDLENYIDNYTKHFPDIVGVLYNHVNPTTCKLSEVQPAVDYYLKWRLLLYKQYKNLFELDHVDLEAGDNKQSKRVKPAHVWFDVVMTLADGKFLNMDHVLARPIYECLNWLAWNKDKKREEAEQLRKQNIHR